MRASRELCNDGAEVTAVAAAAVGMPVWFRLNRAATVRRRVGLATPPSIHCWTTGCQRTICSMLCASACSVTAGSTELLACILSDDDSAGIDYSVALIISIR